MKNKFAVQELFGGFSGTNYETRGHTYTQLSELVVVKKVFRKCFVKLQSLAPPSLSISVTSTRRARRGAPAGNASEVVAAEMAEAEAGNIEEAVGGAEEAGDAADNVLSASLGEATGGEEVNGSAASAASSNRVAAQEGPSDQSTQRAAEVGGAEANVGDAEVDGIVERLNRIGSLLDGAAAGNEGVGTGQASDEEWTTEDSDDDTDDY